MLLRLLPARRHAVVHGWPADEGNAVEVLRALRRRYRGRVYWLLDDADVRVPDLAAPELDDRSRVVRLRKSTPRGVLLALTAETTFFTHGLYTAVRPPSDRLVVNLWHGDGPKSASDTRLVCSTVAVAGTRLWGAQRAGRFGLPEHAVAVVGNPRTDQLRAGLPAGARARLGLREQGPLVVWVPTYREARGPGSRGWRDGEHLSDSHGVAALVGEMARTARALGVELVVKPHPLDADSFGPLGLPVLRGPDLTAAGVSLYQLLGACDALISDVSSIWTDFLALDRPVAFYLPDLDDLQRRRGLNVDDLEALLPGPRIATAEDAARFLQGVVARSPDLRPSRHPAHARIGPVAEPGATDRLLDWLDAFQRRRGRPALFFPPDAGRLDRSQPS
ncbi:MAG: CDP-glycerol glycerophosphotransferase family protein [Actinomycetota bacterium]|nr:CDP-glycerol glycerophosphotransferase family protein [Actinomycetota bacterium]